MSANIPLELMGFEVLMPIASVFVTYLKEPDLIALPESCL
jgi:hypothetical protein